MTLVLNKHVQFGEPPRLLTHSVGSFEDDFPFPQGGICDRSLEGMH